MSTAVQKCGNGQCHLRFLVKAWRASVAREIARSRFCSKIAPALGNLVSDFGSNAPSTLYLHITNRTGEIESSTKPLSPGRACARVEQCDCSSGRNFRFVCWQSDAGNLEFQVPIRFQARRVGEVLPRAGWIGAIGCSARHPEHDGRGLPDRHAGHHGGHGGHGGGHQRRLIERIGWGMRRMGKGQYDFRLESDRRDEFGNLYRRFQRHGHAP